MPPTSQFYQILSLYRALLRAHQKYLPLAQMRELGDAYVKSEFRLHTQKNPTPAQLGQFQTEWERYLQQLQSAARASEYTQQTEGGVTPPRRVGANLPADTPLNDEQKQQLKKLHEEATKFRTK